MARMKPFSPSNLTCVLCPFLFDKEDLKIFPAQLEQLNSPNERIAEEFFGSEARCNLFYPQIFF